MKLKLFNPMAYFRFLRKLYRYLTAPAPLNDYPSYDEYWERRHASGRNPGLLHRYQVIAELLPADASVLDVGCGDGSFGLHLLSVRPDCKYYGVDISSAAVKILNRRGLEGKVIDPSRRLSDQIVVQFDAVTAMEVIEHVHNAEELMRDISDLASHVIVITIPNSGYILHRLRLAVFGRFPVTTIVFHIKEHIRFWTYRDFGEWIEQFGLNILRFIGQEGCSTAPEKWFARHFPSLFAAQVIYVLGKKRPAGVANSEY